MQLDYYGTLRTVRTIAENNGLSLVFEKGDTQPRTDGKTVYVQQPDPNWDDRRITRWKHTVYHEIRHNWPEFRGAFQWAKEKKLDMSSFIGQTTNCLEDFRIEKYQNKRYDGERYALAEGRRYVIEDTFQYLGASPENVRKAAKEAGMPELTDDQINQYVKDRERTEALLVWDTGIRENWQPELAGLFSQQYDRLNAKSKEYVDKLNAGTYADRMQPEGRLLELDEQYQIVKDIINEVFEMDADEEEKKAQESYQAGDGDGQGEGKQELTGAELAEKAEEGDAKAQCQMDAKILWEDLKDHTHDASGTSYHKLEIDYSNHKAYDAYTPAKDNEITVKDLKKGDCPDIDQRYRKMIADIPSGNLDKSVRNLLQVLSKAKHSYGHKSGKIATRSLHKLTRADQQSRQRIFRQKDNVISLDVSVCVLCDLSGSMGGSKYAHSAKAAIMLNNAVTALGVPLEILGFTTEGYHGLRHVIFKGYNHRIDENTLTDYFSRASENMNANADGDSILWAVNRLAKQKSKRKVLVVLSDGQPAAHRSGDILTFTRNVVKSIEKSPIDVYGIGIENMSVKDIYSQHTIISGAHELESKLLNLVKSKIIN